MTGCLFEEGELCAFIMKINLRSFRRAAVSLCQFDASSPHLLLLETAARSLRAATRGRCRDQHTEVTAPPKTLSCCLQNINKMMFKCGSDKYIFKNTHRHHNTLKSIALHIKRVLYVWCLVIYSGEKHRWYSETDRNKVHIKLLYFHSYTGSWFQLNILLLVATALYQFDWPPWIHHFVRSVTEQILTDVFYLGSCPSFICRCDVFRTAVLLTKLATVLQYLPAGVLLTQHFTV